MESTDDRQMVRQLTEWVRFLFDQVVGSMDWGSGFLDTEEVVEVLAIAEFLGLSADPRDPVTWQGVVEVIGAEPDRNTPEHVAWSSAWNAEYRRQNTAARREMHEQAHKLLLRKFPRAGPLEVGLLSDR